MGTQEKSGMVHIRAAVPACIDNRVAERYFANVFLLLAQAPVTVAPAH